MATKSILFFLKTPFKLAHSLHSEKQNFLFLFQLF